MPLPFFYRQRMPGGQQAFVPGSNQNVFDLPRESVIDQVNLYVEGTITTGAATPAAEGLARLIESVTVRGSLSGQPELVPISGLTGPDLFEIAQFHSNALPQIIGSLGVAGKFRVNIPLYFRENFFGAESFNLLMGIPAYQMSDLTLTVRSALLNVLDTNVAPTLAFGTDVIVGLEVMQYYRDTVPNNAQFIRGQFEVLQDDAIVTNPTREVKLPSGGDYTLILLRSFTSATAKQTDAGVAPFNQPGTIKLYDLSRFTKIETDFLKTRARNLHETIDDALVVGNACMVFNRGIDQIFQTGKAGIALNNIILQYDAIAAAGSRIRVVYRRLFDPANLLAIPRP